MATVFLDFDFFETFPGQKQTMTDSPNHASITTSAVSWRMDEDGDSQKLQACWIDFAQQFVDVFHLRLSADIRRMCEALNIQYQSSR